MTPEEIMLHIATLTREMEHIRELIQEWRISDGLARDLRTEEIARRFESLSHEYARLTAEQERLGAELAGRGGRDRGVALAWAVGTSLAVVILGSMALVVTR